LVELQISDTDDSYLRPGDKEILMNYVDTRMQTLSRKIYWTVVNDEFTDNIIDVSALDVQEDLLEVIE
jgi:hypothetical protein